MTLLALLFLTGVFAGTIDAIAGGGGLLTVPVLLSIGLPPHLAFGTNKLQGTIGTSIATLRFYKKGHLSFEKIYKGACSGAIGSLLGAITGQVLSSEILRLLVPILLGAILIYTIFSPKLGHQETAPRVSEHWFYPFFGFVLGFYDGFFGPGTGAFWVFLLTYFLGYHLIKATAYTKFFNLNSNVIATFCFAIGGNIDYRIGLCMAAGQLIGGKVGADLAMKKGMTLIRPLFLIMVALTICTLIAKNYSTAHFFMQTIRPYGIGLQLILGIALLISIIFYYLRTTKKLKKPAYLPYK